MIFLMVFGAFVSYLIVTNGGTVSVQNTSFYGAEGNVVSANLFIPSTATPATPAPGVLAVEGYNNNKDFMTNAAMELARRGFVVLAIDMPGQGDSSGTPFNYNFNGPDGLTYLQGLAYVNKSDIGLVGMSMGGWSISAAALSSSSGYKSMFFMDSFPVFTPPTLWPQLKDVAIQMSYADEFNPAWLGVATGAQTTSSASLKALFNTTASVVPGQVYGNIAAGTARIYYEPGIDHPQSTDNTASITNVVSWFEMTLGSGSTALANSNMVFPVKQLFLSVSFIAALIFIFTFGGYLLQTDYFKDLVGPLPEYKGFKGAGYWLGAIIVTALGPLLYLWGFGNLGSDVSNYLLPQGFVNDYMAWENLVAAVAVIILVASYFLSLRKAGVTRDDLGLGWSAGKIAKSLVFAILVLVPIYVTLTYCYSLFNTPFTLGVDGFPPIPLVLLPLNDLRAFFTSSYFLTFLPIFLIYGVVFAGFVRYKKGNVSLGKEMIINSIVLSLGSVLLLLYYYIPLYTGLPQTLTNWPYVPGLAMGLLGLDMIYFIPVPLFSMIAACILTYYFRKTGKIWPGVLLTTAFITWYMVAFSAFTVVVA
jgi:pimeloyl-ACP methyl ester carboxylesterase